LQPDHHRDVLAAIDRSSRSRRANAAGMPRVRISNARIFLRSSRQACGASAKWAFTESEPQSTNAGFFHLSVRLILQSVTLPVTGRATRCSRSGRRGAAAGSQAQDSEWQFRSIAALGVDTDVLLPGLSGFARMPPVRRWCNDFATNDASAPGFSCTSARVHPGLGPGGMRCAGALIRHELADGGHALQWTGREDLVREWHQAGALPWSPKVVAALSWSA